MATSGVMDVEQARFHKVCKHFQVSQREEGHPRGFSIEKTGKSQSYLSLNAIRLQNKTNKFRGSLPLEAAAWMFFASAQLREGIPNVSRKTGVATKNPRNDDISPNGSDGNLG